MVDLAKIRKKAKKGNAGVPPPEAPPAATTAGEDAGAPLATGNGQLATIAGEDAGSPLAINKLDRFKEQAGKRRETRVEQVAQSTGLLELLTFAIAGEQYAVEIERIVEIVTPRPITRIPNADHTIVGIISLRGTIVTLVDVRRVLRHPAAPDGADTRIVVIDLGNEIVGFVVDRVLRVVKIAPSEVEAHPVVHTTELVDSIRGVFRISGALTILLDLDKLLDHSQWT